MIVDAYTKAVLTVIAVALVLIASQPLYAPARAEAQIDATDLLSIQADVDSIQADVDSIRLQLGEIRSGSKASLGAIQALVMAVIGELEELTDGSCINPKLC